MYLIYIFFNIKHLTFQLITRFNHKVLGNFKGIGKLYLPYQSALTCNEADPVPHTCVYLLLIGKLENSSHSSQHSELSKHCQRLPWNEIT